ncbi:hypothetical protein ACFL59_09375 [Planctomycetota bacterium]
MADVRWRDIGKTGKPRVPDWLSKARDRSRGGSVSARDVAHLAKDVSSGLGVSVILDGMAIEEAGLAARLDGHGISRSAAYGALVAIGLADCAEDAVEVELEDAVSLQKRESSVDVHLLAEIHQLRACCDDLAEHGAVIVEEKGPIRDLSSLDITTAVLGKKADYGKTTDFAEIVRSWGVSCWDGTSGRFPLDRVINDYLAS